MIDLFSQASFDGAATGVTVSDRDGRFLRVNDRFAEITGYSPIELLELDSRRITHPDDLPLKQKLAARLFAGELPTIVYEKRYLRKDGNIRWVRNNVTLGPPDQSGRETTLAITEDISRLRLLEELAPACAEEQYAARERIARCLHDDAAQLLSALSMELALARNPAEPGDSPLLIDDCLALASHCTREIRTLIHLLQPSHRPKSDLARDLETLASGFAERSGTAVEILIGQIPPVSPQAASILLHICQEWLLTVRRGPDRQGLAISLQPHDGGAQLELLNRFDPAAVYLPELRNRVQWIGGRVQIHTGPAGTKLTIWTPFRVSA